MLFDLLVRKLEHLQAVREGCLSGLRLEEMVHDLAVGVSLFDILIHEKHDRVSVGEYFALDSIRKDYFFLATRKYPLDLTILALNLINQFSEVDGLVVLGQEFQIKLIFFVFNSDVGACLLKVFDLLRFFELISQGIFLFFFFFHMNIL